MTNTAPTAPRRPQELDQHRLDRIRKLEQRVDGLTRYRDQLERAYALACTLLATHAGCDPAQVAAVIHELAEATEHDQLVTLLEETAA